MKKKVLALLVLALMMVSVTGVYTWNAVATEYTEDLCTDPSKAIAKDFYPNRPPSKAFDNATSGGYDYLWTNNEASVPTWIGYDFGTGVKIQKYRIFPFENMGPKSWILQGTNDVNNGPWVSLQTVTNEPYWTGWKEFTLINDNSFRYYRLLINENHYSSEWYTMVYEIEMMSAAVSAPSAPTNLQATAGNAQVSLSWTEVEGATSYKVKRSTTQGGPYDEIATNITATEYTNTGLTNGTPYYYVVTAVNSAGESANSNEASATPQDNTPPPATGNNLLRIRMTDGQELEFQMSAADVQSFITWYNGHSQPSYMINKTYNAGPFTSRKVYIAWEKVVDFEVMNY